jgi:hypothetical protein
MRDRISQLRITRPTLSLIVSCRRRPMAAIESEKNSDIPQ